MKPWFLFKSGSQKRTRNLQLYCKSGSLNGTKKCLSGQINTTLHCPLLWLSGSEVSSLTSSKREMHFKGPDFVTNNKNGHKYWAQLVSSWVFHYSTSKRPKNWPKFQNCGFLQKWHKTFENQFCGYTKFSSMFYRVNKL